MKRSAVLPVLVSSLLLALPARNADAQQYGAAQNAAAADALAHAKPGRDPKQPIDEAYTKKIKQYTTEPFFSSPLVDYLPASKTVPTPAAVLGDIAGNPAKLPYSTDVYKYMRMLAKASPRVRVYSIGRTEEGREMIAVAVASEQIMAHLDENDAKLAKLADPRTIHMNDAEAAKLIPGTVPVYYITGTIHSPESGAPSALMELAYRLAVDNSPYIRDIRDHLITLITPIVEVDGRDREVDVTRWHMAHPDETYPRLVYWGHYVAHDNNRDAMGLTLKLSQNVLNTYLHWHAQVLHDLHESVPFLYDNTVGDGPYNAWIDPLLANEWRMIGWNNVQEMTRFGMPGVFAHGDFDTWSPGYLMFLAAMHNGISRLYETFGNGGTPETLERTLSPDETSRTWYRQDPPLPHVKWSIRDNNNYEETGLLVSLHYFANNRQLFLQNFYQKSKRSILKAHTEGPAAYVLPADDPRLGAQAALLRVLQKQHVEISRATAPFTVKVREEKGERREAMNDSASKDSAAAGSPSSRLSPLSPRTFPAGSYIVRMDQPYSRIADALLDYQYWSPDDPQKHPYDDTGWTFPEGFAVDAVRVTDPKVLDAPMRRVTGEVRAPGGVTGSGGVFVIDNNADNALTTLRYQLKSADFQAAEAPFTAAGHSFDRGSFIISNVSAANLDSAAKALGLEAYAVSAAPHVATHPLRAARIAILHTWSGTQTEGWWREAFDFLHIPYTYINVQDVARDANLNAKYDVILFPPAGGNGLSIIEGMPMWRNPMPWKKTALTPNIGILDSTNDIRPGLGWDGLEHLQHFVAQGGVLVGVGNTADFAISYGLTNGVSDHHPSYGHVVGSLLRTTVVDSTSPIAYGIRNDLAVYSEDGESFSVSNMRSGRGFRRGSNGEPTRPTGRGTVHDPDVVQGRPALDSSFMAPPRPTVKPWQAAPLTAEQLRDPLNVIPPDQRPRVVLRFTERSHLLASGLLDGGNDIAQRPVVVDVPVQKGHVVLFANNPVYRGETIGSYPLVFNTILNFDHLDAGREGDTK
ncbi:MAG TPA: M14 family zinc carboxypeptidase [Gemmatimonadaceae bacterium]|nr:M14 family zinc carboxypeptidase [Gemmatimonadaceae bacterium]